MNFQPTSGQTSDEKKSISLFAQKNRIQIEGGTLGVRLNIRLHILVGKAEKSLAMLSPPVGVFAKKNKECDEW